MTELTTTQEGKFMQVEDHGFIGVATHRYSILCRSEIKVFHRLLGNNYQIEGTEHRVSGSCHCAYVVMRRES